MFQRERAGGSVEMPGPKLLAVFVEGAEDRFGYFAPFDGIKTYGAIGGRHGLHHLESFVAGRGQDGPAHNGSAGRIGGQDENRGRSGFATAVGGNHSAAGLFGNDQDFPIVSASLQVGDGRIDGELPSHRATRSTSECH